MHLKQKNMERKFPFSLGEIFCAIKKRGSLHAMYKPPRQKFFEFSPPLQRRGIFCVLLFNYRNYFSFVAKRFLIVLTNSLETPK